ncbi:MAG: hypothetical protein ABI128_10725 [Rhodanobacter sp.]
MSGVLIFLVATLGEQDGSRLMYDVFSREGFLVASWMFAVFSLMFVMMPVELLTQRWGRPNAELALRPCCRTWAIPRRPRNCCCAPP